MKKLILCGLIGLLLISVIVKADSDEKSTQFKDILKKLEEREFDAVVDTFEIEIKKDDRLRTFEKALLQNIELINDPRIQKAYLSAKGFKINDHSKILLVDFYRGNKGLEYRLLLPDGGTVVLQPNSLIKKSNIMSNKIVLPSGDIIRLGSGESKIDLDKTLIISGDASIKNPQISVIGKDGAVVTVGRLTLVSKKDKPFEIIAKGEEGSLGYTIKSAAIEIPIDYRKEGLSIIEKYREILKSQLNPEEKVKPTIHFDQATIKNNELIIGAGQIKVTKGDGKAPIFSGVLTGPLSVSDTLDCKSPCMHLDTVKNKVTIDFRGSKGWQLISLLDTEVDIKADKPFMIDTEKYNSVFPLKMKLTFENKDAFALLTNGEKILARVNSEGYAGLPPISGDTTVVVNDKKINLIDNEVFLEGDKVGYMAGMEIATGLGLRDKPSDSVFSLPLPNEKELAAAFSTLEKYREQIIAEAGKPQHELDYSDQLIRAQLHYKEVIEKNADIVDSLEVIRARNRLLAAARELTGGKINVKTYLIIEKFAKEQLPEYAADYTLLEVKQAQLSQAGDEFERRIEAMPDGPKKTRLQKKLDDLTDKAMKLSMLDIGSRRNVIDSGVAFDNLRKNVKVILKNVEENAKIIERETAIREQEGIQQLVDTVSNENTFTSFGLKDLLFLGMDGLIQIADGELGTTDSDTKTTTKDESPSGVMRPIDDIEEGPDPPNTDHEKTPTVPTSEKRKDPSSERQISTVNDADYDDFGDTSPPNTDKDRPPEKVKEEKKVAEKTKTETESKDEKVATARIGPVGTIKKQKKQQIKIAKQKVSEDQLARKAPDSTFVRRAMKGDLKESDDIVGQTVHVEVRKRGAIPDTNGKIIKGFKVATNTADRPGSQGIADTFKADVSNGFKSISDRLSQKAVEVLNNKINHPEHGTISKYEQIQRAISRLGYQKQPKDGGHVGGGVMLSGKYIVAYTEKVEPNGERYVYNIEKIEVTKQIVRELKGKINIEIEKRNRGVTEQFRDASGDS